MDTTTQTETQQPTTALHPGDSGVWARHADDDWSVSVFPSGQVILVVEEPGHPSRNLTMSLHDAPLLVSRWEGVREVLGFGPWGTHVVDGIRVCRRLLEAQK